MKLRLVVVVLLAALTGCGDPNPLLGDWQVTSGPDSIAQTISFTESQFITGTMTDNVSYKIQDEQVLVTSSSGVRLTYKLIDADTLQVTLPGIGPISYSKISQ